MDGTWQFTQWARASLLEKTREISKLIKPASRFHRPTRRKRQTSSTRASAIANCSANAASSRRLVSDTEE